MQRRLGPHLVHIAMGFKSLKLTAGIHRVRILGGIKTTWAPAASSRQLIRSSPVRRIGGFRNPLGRAPDRRVDVWVRIDGHSRDVKPQRSTATRDLSDFYLRMSKATLGLEVRSNRFFVGSQLMPKVVFLLLIDADPGRALLHRLSLFFVLMCPLRVQ